MEVTYIFSLDYASSWIIFQNSETEIIFSTLDELKVRVYTYGVDMSIDASHKTYPITLNGENVTFPLRSQDLNVYPLKGHLHVDHSDFRLSISTDEVVLTYISSSNVEFNGLCGNNIKFMSGEMISAEHIPIADQLEFVSEWSLGEAIVTHFPESSIETKTICQSAFQLEAFRSCRREVPLEPFMKACEKFVATHPNPDSYCKIVNSFARECNRAGLQLPDWWSTDFCNKSCHGNKIFQQNGIDCIETCSGKVVGHCDSFSAGCQCPPGMLYQDIEADKKGHCVYPFDCPCVHNGVAYKEGEQINNKCETCLCTSGNWECSAADCPGKCTLGRPEGLIQYDGRTVKIPNTDCTYILSQTDQWKISSHLEHEKMKHLQFPKIEFRNGLLLTIQTNPI